MVVEVVAGVVVVDSNSAIHVPVDVVPAVDEELVALAVAVVVEGEAVVEGEEVFLVPNKFLQELRKPSF